MFSYQHVHRLGVLLVAVCSFHSGVTSAEEALRDPTQPIGFRRATLKSESLKLQAIFLGSGRKEAIINGVSVKEGSTISGQKVESIRDNQVVVSRDGTRETLILRSKLLDK